jgi:hypothetical protein
MIDPQILIDRMLENENLTGNLDDEDADWLLDWGADRLREFGDSETMEAAEKKAGALMKFMRGLDRLAGGLPGVDPTDLAALLEHYTAALGSARVAGQVEIEDAAASISYLTPRQALGYLINWCAPSSANAQGADHA